MTSIVANKFLKEEPCAGLMKQTKRKCAHRSLCIDMTHRTHIGIELATVRGMLCMRFKEQLARRRECCNFLLSKHASIKFPKIGIPHASVPCHH